MGVDLGRVNLDREFGVVVASDLWPACRDRDYRFAVEGQVLLDGIYGPLAIRRLFGALPRNPKIQGEHEYVNPRHLFVENDYYISRVGEDNLLMSLNDWGDVGPLRDDEESRARLFEWCEWYQGEETIEEYGVFEHVENSLKRDSERGKTRAELQEELQSRKERVNELETELRRKKKLIEALEEEVRKHRSKEFLQEPGPKTREYDEELIQVLKTSTTVENDEILNRLDVDHGETEAVKAINKQLELLESYGLVKSTKRGWRWRH